MLVPEFALDIITILLLYMGILFSKLSSSITSTNVSSPCMGKPSSAYNANNDYNLDIKESGAFMRCTNLYFIIWE